VHPTWFRRAPNGRLLTRARARRGGWEQVETCNTPVTIPHTTLSFFDVDAGTADNCEGGTCYRGGERLTVWGSHKYYVSTPSTQLNVEQTTDKQHAGVANSGTVTRAGAGARPQTVAP
jgi:hypothetical protein